MAQSKAGLGGFHSRQAAAARAHASAGPLLPRNYE